VFRWKRYPACTFAVWDHPLTEPCPRCAAPFVTEKLTKRYGTVRRCAREGCGWQARLDDDSGAWVEMAAAPPRAAARIRRRGVDGQPAVATGADGAAARAPTRKKAARKEAARQKAAKPTDKAGQEAAPTRITKQAPAAG